ncbi:MAG: ATP-binding protein, partial [Cyclobacteriaceae bacterium]|nr:ATP-binding protein [Cyclobacteriaceae bacterium]
NEVVSFNEKNEILLNGFFQLLEDQNDNYWFTYGKGVVQIKKEDLFNLTISDTSNVIPYTYYGKGDGMRSGEITGPSTSSISGDGSLWFCTFNGVSVLNTNAIEINNYSTPVKIETFKTDTELIDVFSRNKVEIPAGNNRIDIEFTGLSYAEPTSINFKYKLEGFDEEWIESGGERKTSYTNLSPGRYIFKVKASNSDGIWSEDEDELEIIKVPFFYEILWVQILFIFVVAGFTVYLARKRANFLKNINLKLSRTVEERTKELKEKNNSLDVTVKKLEVSNRDLQRFAYIASHDLKSPLRGISMMTEFIAADNEDQLDENGKTQLALLKSRVKIMSDLIDGILAYSRAGVLVENRKKIDLNEIIQLTLDLISPPDHINIQIIGELPTIEEDDVAIQQLFQNLLTNAIKFNDKPKGEIKIGYSDNETFHEFYISDNGSGINERDFEKIFTIFQVAHTIDNIESTGIGLSIVKKIIEALDGEIRVESELKKGTTFIFSWPKR